MEPTIPTPYRADPESWRAAAASLERSPLNRVIYTLWRRWERFNTGTLMGLEPVVAGRPSIFRIRPARYRGAPVRLEDGTWLRPGDPIGDLHFVTDALLGAHAVTRGPVQLATYLARLAEDSLHVLADFIAQTEPYRQVVAVHGITLIHRGARRLGFTVWDLPPGFKRSFLSFYLRAFLSTMHPGTLSRVRQRRDLLHVKHVAMSRELLLQRYGSPAGAGPTLP
ncbi:YkoP family protein [Limnochorda sp.]|uniref:YkoP family protein n=1 Tax=Limnochorda sp. TaxID=1940279 RepID=UPI001D38A6FC|nr:hypothetical protein [Bacillota bacterium]